MCVDKGYQAAEHFSPTSGDSGGIGDFPKDPLHPVKKEIGTELLCLIVFLVLWKTVVPVPSCIYFFVFYWFLL